MSGFQALARFHLHVGARLAMRAAAPLPSAPDRLRVLEPLARGEAVDPAAH